MASWSTAATTCCDSVVCKLKPWALNPGNSRKKKLEQGGGEGAWTSQIREVSGGQLQFFRAWNFPGENRAMLGPRSGGIAGATDHQGRQVNLPELPGEVHVA